MLFHILCICECSILEVSVPNFKSPDTWYRYSEVRVDGTEPEDDVMEDNLISSSAIAIPNSRGASVWVWYSSRCGSIFVS